MQRIYLTLLIGLSLVAVPLWAIAAEKTADQAGKDKAEAKEQSPSPVVTKYKRLILLGKGDKTPENFVGRQGPGGVVRQIDTFRKTVPEDKGYKSRFLLGTFYNMNYGKHDDYIIGCEPVNPKGQVDGTAWYYLKVVGEGGGPRRDITFRNGVRHGPEISRERGQKRVLPWVDGKIHGTATTYNADGNVISTSEYVRGELHGPSVSYNEEGKVVRKVEYEDGKKNGLMVEYWRRTFKPKKEIHYKDGLAHGTAKLYYDHGQLKMEARLWEDNYHGVQKFYHEDGELRKTVYWLMDQEVPEGKFKREYKWPPVVEKKEDDKDEGDKKK